MRRKPVTKRMVEASSPMWGLSHIRTVKCTECGNPFDVTSAEWAYKVRVQGCNSYQCSWSCLKKAKARLNPSDALRGDSINARCL